MKYIYIDLFALISIVSCFSLILSVNPIYSMIHLINVFINVSILLALKQIEYFCFLFLLIYVGAISILFLFIIMMLNIKLKNYKNVFSKNIPLGIIFLVLLLAEILFIINYTFSGIFIDVDKLPTLFTNWYVFDQMHILYSLGQVLYTNYLFYLLFAGLILLVAIYGSVFLTQDEEPSFITESEKQLSHNNLSVFLINSKN